LKHCNGDKLFNASKELFKNSGLVIWNEEQEQFLARNSGDDREFEKYAIEKFGQGFGRYNCWVMFSVGAENLAKAACVCNEIDELHLVDPKNLGYPIYSTEMNKPDWVQKVLKPQQGQYGDREARKYDYGTLGKYWSKHLNVLCEKCEVDPKKASLLKACYKYFTEVIRNRDAHTYIENVRRDDFPAVEAIFVPAFNVLVKTLDERHFED